jgi:hypothetical protein
VTPADRARRDVAALTAEEIARGARWRTAEQRALWAEGLADALALEVPAGERAAYTAAARAAILDRLAAGA